MVSQAMKAVNACLALLLFVSTAALAAEPWKKAPGPYTVSSTLDVWNDASRHRQVPVKIYAPATGKGPFPVIVFSHGLGGSREGYSYLGRHWASYGYVSVHLDHPGSDTDAFRGQGKDHLLQNLRAAAEDRHNALARPLDVRFAIDQLEKINQGKSPLAHRLDLGRIGMAGHSFGAWTTLVAAGETLGPGGASFADPRIKAAIAMSAPAPRKGMDLDRAFAGIHMPVLHMTGTLDDSPIGETSAAERRVPYDHIRAGGQYLVTFQGGDHMIFSGRLIEAGQKREKDELFQDLILQGTTAFWDAYLQGDSRARAWLAQGGYAAILGKDGKLEEK